MQVRSPGREDPLEEGMVTHSHSPGMRPLTPQSNQAAQGGQCPSGKLRTAYPTVSGTPVDSRSAGTCLISLKKIDLSLDLALHIVKNTAAATKALLVLRDPPPLLHKAALHLHHLF